MRSKGTLAAGAIIAAVLAGIVLAQSYDAGTEMTLIEKVLKSRDEYKASLTELLNYYNRVGDAAMSNRAQRELKAFGLAEKYDYARKTVEKVEGPVKILKYVPEADDYYADGKMFAGSNRKATRDIALARFEKILTTWPESDKAPLAAYEMGEVYSGYYHRDFDLAAKYYQKTYELDPATSLPALLKAGDMFMKVKRTDEAVKMYKLAVEGSADPAVRDKAQRALDNLSKTGK